MESWNRFAKMNLFFQHQQWVEQNQRKMTAKVWTQLYVWLKLQDKNKTKALRFLNFCKNRMFWISAKSEVQVRGWDKGTKILWVHFQKFKMRLKFSTGAYRHMFQDSASKYLILLYLKGIHLWPLVSSFPRRTNLFLSDDLISFMIFNYSFVLKLNNGINRANIKLQQIHIHKST